MFIKFTIDPFRISRQNKKEAPRGRFELPHPEGKPDLKSGALILAMRPRLKVPSDELVYKICGQLESNLV